MLRPRLVRPTSTDPATNRRWMVSADALGQREGVRYQPDENPPVHIAAGLGLQFAILIIARIVVVPVVIVRAAGGSEADLAWMFVCRNRNLRGHHGDAGAQDRPFRLGICCRDGNIACRRGRGCHGGGRRRPAACSPPWFSSHRWCRWCSPSGSRCCARSLLRPSRAR